MTHAQLTPFNPTSTNYQVASVGEPSGTCKLVDSFFESLSSNTQEAYRQDLTHFMEFVGAESVSDATLRLWGNGHGEANALALEWRNHLVGQGLSPATVNRRLSALRSLCELGQTTGYIGWTLKVKGVKSKSYRDTKGPGFQACTEMLRYALGRKDFKGKRDAAILALLITWGLRRSEIANLDLDDLDTNNEAPMLRIIGKGRTEPEKISLPAETAEILAEYIETRGPDPGPLFIRYKRQPDKRLTAHGIFEIVKAAGEAVGISKAVSPHRLRHSAITEALDRGASIRDAQSFSRHADVRVLMRYDDNRRDGGGKVAARLAAQLKEEPTCQLV